jgi:tRNA (guanine-N7-)-methyltransferase
MLFKEKKPTSQGSIIAIIFSETMKPKDLKSLFTFEHRRPALSDHIFYVPIHYHDYECFKLPCLHLYFNNTHPVSVEYCSGNGDWIIEKAKNNPQHNWIAVEKRFDRVKKIWAKLKNQGIDNVLIVSGEALTFTKHYLQGSSIDDVYINFPDPWPKNKHAKHRLLQPIFLDELSRILKSGKKMTLVTDDTGYVSQTTALFCKHTAFEPAYDAPYFRVDVADYGGSWFETLWREKGKQIHYMEFIKK